MQIKYKNTLEDIYEFHKFYNKIKNKKITISQILIYSYPVICIYIVVKFIYDNYGKTREIMLLSITAFFFTLIWSKFMTKTLTNLSSRKLKTYLKNEIKNNPTLLSEKIIELTSDKLILTSKSLRSEIFLNSISELIENNGNTYVFINNYNMFAIIPNLAFVNKDEKNIFIKKITDNMIKKVES